MLAFLSYVFLKQFWEVFNYIFEKATAIKHAHLIRGIQSVWRNATFVMLYSYSPFAATSLHSKS